MEISVFDSGPGSPLFLSSGFEELRCGGRDRPNMEATDRVKDCVEPALAAMGYCLVRVRWTGSERRILQVMVERADEAALSVDDCAAASAAISAILDVEDPVSGPYTLEVSSPGIDRPLVRPSDFDRYRGFEARIETSRPIDGRKRFRGRLLGVFGNLVRVRLDEGTAEIRFDDIAQAKLVLNDELIEAGRSREGA